MKIGHEAKTYKVKCTLSDHVRMAAAAVDMAFTDKDNAKLSKGWLLNCPIGMLHYTTCFRCSSYKINTREGGNS